MRIHVLIGCLALIGCTETHEVGDAATDEAAGELMGWLYDAHPREDVAVAIAKGDLRFRGVYGYSLEVPAVTLRCISDAENDVLPIEGTSDALESYEQEKLNALARVYADYYNTLLLQYRRDNHGFKCD